MLLISGMEIHPKGPRGITWHFVGLGVPENFTEPQGEAQSVVDAVNAIGGVMICCTSFLINDDFRMVVIGIIGTWINGLAIDYFTASLNKRKRVCIVSAEPERIRKYIVEDLVRGCSLYDVTGGYSGEKHVEIQTLLTQDEFSSVMAFIRNNKIQAFITAGNCSEVYGLWFRHKKIHGKTVVVNE